MIIPVILSGGSGTRLWPLSTPTHPKQFLSLVGEGSLFRQTLERVGDRSRYAAPIVVASAAHEDLCHRELKGVEGAQLIFEPMPRNTAVAIVMAAALSLRLGEDGILLVMPSDHRIGTEAAFHQAVEQGASAALAGHLVTFGIAPASAETGYGYLQSGEKLDGLDGVTRVARFKEKPDLESARAMLAAGNHFWNGGIFMFRASRFLEECERLAPEVYRAGMDAVEQGEAADDGFRPAPDALLSCPNISVDYAVMERSSAIAMVTLDADWSDVGSWDALADLVEASGEGQATTLNSSGCFVRTDGPAIALLGVEDLIVVASGKQVVVMKRGSSQDIKELAAKVLIA